MRIEIWHGKVGKVRAWYWHMRAVNGKIVSDAEAFPSRANAVRAAKALVRAVFRRAGYHPLIEATKPDASGVTVIRWS